MREGLLKVTRALNNLFNLAVNLFEISPGHWFLGFLFDLLTWVTNNTTVLNKNSTQGHLENNPEQTKCECGR